MVTLNDYLYSGDTMFKILKNYSQDLKAEAKQTNNEIHANFLIQIRELLEHNDFLTTQSQKIREFYIHMAKEYPLLAFNFKGRIKSLIRSEAKFNGYIVEYIYDCYTEHIFHRHFRDLRFEAEIELFPRPDRVPDRDFTAEVLPETGGIAAGGGYPVPLPDCK